MYGTNPVAKARAAEDGFLVHSIFYTIQGEGPLAGHPAIFLRLAGCNLRCSWCDTQFDGGEHYTLDALAQKLQEEIYETACDLVVITGGEPMLQELGLLFNHYLLMDTNFQIETAGSVWPESLTDFVGNDRLAIVCSPKTPNVHPMIAQHADYFKYIIRKNETAFLDGLPNMSTQLPGKTAGLFRPVGGAHSHQAIYVQACDERDDPMATKANLVEAARIAMEFGYRLSVQLHKIVGLD